MFREDKVRWLRLIDKHVTAAKHGRKKRERKRKV